VNGTGNPFRRREPIKSSPDFLRIKNLPVRNEQDVQDLVTQMTEALRQPGGKMQLFPVQARALYEILTEGGLLGPMGVGTGKTLVCLLAATVLDAERAVLLMPASILEDKKRERAELLNHWKVSTSTQFMSYQMLGRDTSARFFELKRPDLIICDEVHKLKNTRNAACTRRVLRWMAEHPETKFVGVSGTIIKKSLRDFAHIARWVLGDEGAPVPQEHGELEEWADALDEKVPAMRRKKPGVLVQLAKPEDIGEDDLQTARRAFRRRLTSTPGIVASLNSDNVDCSLIIEGKLFNVNAATEENFKTLRTKWETPDGWPLAEAAEVWAKARELALGFHYVWDPRPEDEWLAARKAWAKFCRKVLSNSEEWDTELQVRKAVENEELEDAGLLAAWKAQLDSGFVINQKAVWHDTSALEICEAWLKREKGIAWTSHAFFGRELARRSGFPYFGQNGLDKDGRFILDAKGAFIASIAANGTGRNLQKQHHKNLITCPPSGGDTLEQLLGRTHREGQDEDEVTAEMMIGCLENITSFWSAKAEAEMSRDMLGAPQKILIADGVDSFPTEADVPQGEDQPRWTKTTKKKGEESY
jgi:hypothetical protein